MIEAAGFNSWCVAFCLQGLHDAWMNQVDAEGGAAKYICNAGGAFSHQGEAANDSGDDGQGAHTCVPIENLDVAGGLQAVHKVNAAEQVKAEEGQDSPEDVDFLLEEFFVFIEEVTPDHLDGGWHSCGECVHAEAGPLVVGEVVKEEHEGGDGEEALHALWVLFQIFDQAVEGRGNCHQDDVNEDVPHVALGIYEGVASDDGIKDVQVFLAGVVQDIDGTCGQIWIHDEEGQGADEHHWDGHMSQGSLHYFFVVEIAEHEEARYDPEDCYAICHEALNQATAEFCIIGICGNLTAPDMNTDYNQGAKEAGQFDGGIFI